MSLGERLYNLRKSKNLSQEEVADKLNVTRQTVSKWETDESKPDFDKIVPICELYNITSEELLTGKKENSEVASPVENKEGRKQKAIFISTAILLYFIGVIWIVVGETTFSINEGLLVGIFLLICGIATAMLVYQGIVLSDPTTKEKKVKDKKLESINEITAGLFCIVYFLVSFITMAWHITWIIWILYAVVTSIIEIIYNMKGEKNGK